MINVDIVTRDMHQLHGANRVTEKLIKGYDIFKNAGYNLRYVISQDGIINCSQYNESLLGKHLETSAYQNKRRLIEKAKALPLYTSKFVQTKLVEKEIRNNRTTLEYYKKLDVKPDIVIFQDPFTAIYFIQNRVKIAKSIFISHADQDPLEQLLLSRPSLMNSKEELLLRRRLENMFKYVNKVVTICTSSQEYMKKTYGLDTACIINGIEDVEYSSNKLSKHDGKIHLATVASLQYRKGQDLLIDALSLLDINRRNNIILHFIGNGDYESVLKERVKKNSVDNNIVFHGAVLDVNSLLIQMDGFILSSRADTVPISIIEAMRVGLPVFASGVGEIPNMIKGCGRVISPDVEVIAVLFNDIIDGNIDLLELGNLSRKRYLEKFNLDSMIHNYITVLNSI